MNDFFRRCVTSISLIFILCLALTNLIFLFFILFLISFFSLIEFNYIFKKIFKKKNFFKFLSIFFSLIYIIIFSLFIWFFLIPFNNTKIISLLFILLICSSTDIGGYIFGKLIGGKKLTKISPKKTYSGVLGSFTFAVIFGSFFYYLLKNFLNLEFNYIIVILLVSLISQLGDLVISFLKRKAKIKDSGTILPGHGGILDRIDGILFAVPFGISLISI